MEGEPMCCSVRGGNTISIVQSPAVNGAAGEISPLSPEEHLRTEHLRVFKVSASARPQWLQTSSATETLQSAEQRAEVMKQNRDDERLRGKHISWTLSLPFPPICYFFPSAFSFHPVASLSLSLSIPLSPPTLFALSLPPAPSTSPSLSIHTTISPWFPERDWYSSSRHTN